MLDFRIETFLTLCETKNYTQTAKLLHITQPTVTQHIQYLEKQYASHLFTYSGKSLQLTNKGKMLRDFAMSMRVNSMHIQDEMHRHEGDVQPLNFGVTRTIGEYVIPTILSSYLKKKPNTNIILNVDNTQNLLTKLTKGDLDFTLIEGNFKKADYDYKLFKRETFVGVCSTNHPLANRRITFDDLLKERLIIRESGSGTRDILEQVLKEYNLELSNFPYLTQISNFAILKELIKESLGVTFVYEPVVAKELQDGTLCKLNIQDFTITREFNFVSLKHNLSIEKFQPFYDFCVNSTQ